MRLHQPYRNQARELAILFILLRRRCAVGRHTIYSKHSQTLRLTVSLDLVLTRKHQLFSVAPTLPFSPQSRTQPAWQRILSLVAEAINLGSACVPIGIAGGCSLGGVLEPHLPTCLAAEKTNSAMDIFHISIDSLCVLCPSQFAHTTAKKSIWCIANLFCLLLICHLDIQVKLLQLHHLFGHDYACFQATRSIRPSSRPRHVSNPFRYST